jgi:hypothetical protein
MRHTVNSRFRVYPIRLIVREMVAMEQSTPNSLHIALHRIALHRIASHRIASHRIASHRIASPQRIASHHRAPHRIAPPQHEARNKSVLRI